MPTRLAGSLREVAVSLASVYLAVETPLLLVLDLEPPRAPYWVATLALMADAVLQVRAAVRGRRLRGWLAADLPAAIPFRAIPGAGLLELLRLAKLARTFQLLGRWRRHAVQYSSQLLLLFFVFWLLLVAHWLACGWLALGGIEAGADPLTRYVRALYWCITTLATVGYGDIVPNNNPQTVYSMLVILCGVAGYSWVIGNVANLLANLDRARQHHSETVERLAAFLRYRNVPVELQRRLREYFAYLWEHRLGYDEASAMAELPQGLREEVAAHLRRDLIERTPLFRTAGQELVRELALQLRPAVFTPGEYIFRAGEPGANMYFIGRGAVEIVAPGGAVLATLRDGDFFGEMALLFSQRRTASARAADYSDVYALDKDTFERVIARYPAFAAHIEQEARRRSGE